MIDWLKIVFILMWLGIHTDKIVILTQLNYAAVRVNIVE